MKLTAADKEIACSRCHRIMFGSGITKTRRPAKHKLHISLVEEQSRGPVEPDYSTICNWELCVDCRPIIEDKVHAAITAICGFPLYVRRGV